MPDEYVDMSTLILFIELILNFSINLDCESKIETSNF